MKCRPGDLALIVRGNNAGKIVTCIELAYGAPEDCRLYWPLWAIDREVEWYGCGTVYKLAYFPDDSMVPIHPLNDEQDATPEAIDYEVSV